MFLLFFAQNQSGGRHAKRAAKEKRDVVYLGGADPRENPVENPVKHVVFLRGLRGFSKTPYSHTVQGT